MSSSLNMKQLVWIVAAAMLGLVFGFVIITNLGGDTPTTPDTRMGAITTTSVRTADALDGTVVPNVVGQRLLAAEDQLKERGFIHLQERDASPQNRLIIDKDNWVVESQTPAAGSATPLETVIVLHVKKNTDAAVPSQAEEGVVPNVVCAELQAAQDALRKSGFLLITSKDGTGQGRIPLVDRNWVVIEQSENAGTRPPTTTVIVLTVVRHGESTGDSGCQS
jgi:beta-lactam-binding protein with PASTA domain